MRGTVVVRAFVVGGVISVSALSCALFGFDDLEGGELPSGSDAAPDGANVFADGALIGDGAAPINCANAPPQSWKTISPGLMPSRDETAIFWTGTDFLMFGGIAWGSEVNPEIGPDGGALPGPDGGRPPGCGVPFAGDSCSDGARYNVATDTWTPISNIGSPAPYRWDMSWAFGDQKLFTYSGHGLVVGGWTYDLPTDTWSLATETNAPTVRAYHASYFVNGEFFVWGGESLDTPDASVPYGTPLSSGALYDPKADTWTAINPSTGFAGTAYYATATSDTEFFVWGGTTDPAPWLNEVVDVTNTGAIYNYVTNSWKAISTVNAPDARRYAAAVWTGSKFVVWGGTGANGNFYYNTGGIYDPKTDTWTPTSLTNAPATGIFPHTMVWTGKRVLIWGNPPPVSGVAAALAGAIFDPQANAWDEPITLTNAPTFANNIYVGYASPWNGTQMIQWGDVSLPDGGWANPSAGALYTPPCAP